MFGIRQIWSIWFIFYRNIEQFVSEIKILKSNKIQKIFFKNLKWTKKKNFKELLRVGDVIFIKKIENNWVLKQLPLKTQLKYSFMKTTVSKHIGYKVVGSVGLDPTTNR